MENTLNNSFKDMPEIIDLSIKMNNANEVIGIYEGLFNLQNEDVVIKINGKIQYHWFPEKGAKFEGVVLEENNDPLKTINSLNDYFLQIEGLSVGKAFITNRTFGLSKDAINIKGVFVKNVVIGDSSINVDSITFSIPNLKQFYGTPVKKKLKESVSCFKSRIELDNDDYLIFIDKTINYEERIKNLESNGGSLLLYSGRIVRKKGDLTFDNSMLLFDCLDTFLTFVNGRRIETIFHKGLYQDDPIWSDFSNYTFDAYKKSTSWTKSRLDEGLNDLFKRFCEIWKDVNDRNFLVSVVHWYIQANNNSGYTEGSIVMAQTALELIYNWLLIERKGLLLGRDADNISAANKIRLLLAHLKISTKVPVHFSELESFVDSSKEYNDAPDAIVQIRNAIIHSQIEKRKKISALSLRTKDEALQLSIWYIEMSLLYILEYKGDYSNRCSNDPYPKNRVEKVPWV
ncbi:hypothetical protein [Olleya namhaensis]|uniref:hypothetical protein n=1 Tax=Olleya namhaensis TaxID=1144750 RepID=UPI00248FA2DD|nr:hypothetical protein [Olleya namhaensis]